MIAVMAAMAAAAPQPGSVATVFGQGNVSCATAFEPRNEFETRAWIFGFWSGLNVAGLERIGSGSDGAGVAAEVKLACDANPSQPLILAVMEARQKVKAAGF